MVLNLLEEQKYVLEVQAAHNLSRENWTSTAENKQILRVAKRANQVLTDENFYLILRETQRFYPYQYREFASYSDFQVEYADSHSWREYVHEGVLGLYEAIIRFETSRGFRLSSFAVSWIRGSISRLNKKQLNNKIPFEKVEQFCLATLKEEEEVSISNKEFELIKGFVDSLNPIDKDILNRCFGLNNYEKISLIAIGRCNNLNPKQVGRRRDRILRNLRTLLDHEDKSEQNKALLHCLRNDISLLAS